MRNLSYTPRTSFLYGFVRSLYFQLVLNSLVIILFHQTVPQVSSVTITPANPSIAKGGDVTLSCNANALPGAQITWKKGTVALATIGVYEVGTVAFSNDNNNYKLAMTLKITATASYIASSFQSCSVTDSSQGSTECKQSYECSASYGGISSSLKSTTTEVTVTGLQGMIELDLICCSRIFSSLLFFDLLFVPRQYRLNKHL